jgi:hypothetical protein
MSAFSPISFTISALSSANRSFIHSLLFHRSISHSDFLQLSSDTDSFIRRIISTISDPPPTPPPPPPDFHHLQSRIITLTTSLQARLGSWETRLDGTKKKFTDSASNLRHRYTKLFRQQISRHSQRINTLFSYFDTLVGPPPQRNAGENLASLEALNFELRQRLDLLKYDYEKAVSAIQSELANYSESHPQIRELQIAHETELAHLSKHCNETEFSLNEKLRKLQTIRETEKKQFEAEIEFWKSRITAIEEQLKSEAAKLKNELADKDLELQNLKMNQKNEIEQLENENRAAIERLKSDSRKVLLSIENEIAAISKQKRNCDEELRESNAQIENEIARISKQKRHSVEDLRELNAHFENETSRKLNELEKRRTEYDFRIRGMKSSVVDGSSELIERIMLQENAIRELKIELERSRVEVAKQKVLSELQEKHGKVVEELRLLKDGKLSDLRECSERLAEARLKNERKIVEIMRRLEGVYEEKFALEKEREKSAVVEFGKWRELRVEVGATIMGIARRFTQESPKVAVRKMNGFVRETLPPLRP